MYDRIHYKKKKKLKLHLSRIKLLPHYPEKKASKIHIECDKTHNSFMWTEIFVKLPLLFACFGSNQILVIHELS